MTLDDLKAAVSRFFDAAILAHGGIVGRPLLAAAKAVSLRELASGSARLIAYITSGSATAALQHLHDLIKGKLDADVPGWMRGLFHLDDRLNTCFAWLIAEEPAVLVHLGASPTESVPPSPAKA